MPKHRGGRYNDDFRLTRYYPAMAMKLKRGRIAPFSSRRNTVSGAKMRGRRLEKPAYVILAIKRVVVVNG